MSRKSLSVEEVGTRARERRRAASEIQRFDRLARLLLLLLVVAGLVAWLGSARDSIPVLLAGYVLLGLSAAALIARVTRTPEAARLPLERYYLPDEQVASLALAEGHRRVHLARGTHRLLVKLFNDRDRAFFSVVLAP